MAETGPDTAGLADAVERALRDLQALEREQADLRAALDGAGANAGDLERDKSLLAERLESALSDAASLREERAELQARHSLILQKNAELSDALAAADEKDAALTRDLEAQRRALSDACDRATQAQARGDGLAAELSRREAIEKALRAEIADRQRRIDALANTEAGLRAAGKSAEHALRLRDLRWDAWQRSRLGRLSLFLLRRRRQWSALKRTIARTPRHPLFDEDYYYASNPDVAASGVDAYTHYLRDGVREGRNPNAMFDTAWYLRNNPDAVGGNPLEHYYEKGAADLRNPHPRFSTRAYLDAHPDVAAASLNPLEHYLRTASQAGNQR